ncbi:MAG: cysteine--tRNA ligase, partial [Sphingomonas sp.]|nr:cysteine--tRNA ligase [Sphingomonas sp.]
VAESAATRGASFAYQRSVIEATLERKALDILEKFDAALSDDLMVPQLLPLLEQALADRAIPPDQRLRLVASMDLVLGLNLPLLRRADLRLRPSEAAIEDAEIDALLAERIGARAAKDFATSDRIRDVLAARGVSVMDGAGEISWDWTIQLT